MSKREHADSDSDEGWVGPMPSEAVQPKKRKGLIDITSHNLKKILLKFVCFHINKIRLLIYLGY